MQNRVFVSGMGIITSLGSGVSVNRDRLQKGTKGIGETVYLKTRLKHLPTGEIAKSNETLSGEAGISFNETTSRTLLLGLIAAREAVHAVDVKESFLNDLYFINSSTVGGMDRSEIAFPDVLEKGAINTSYFEGHDVGHSTEFISNVMGIRGGTQTISTACSSSANSIMNGARMIRAGMSDKVLAGGTDALSLFTLNGFNSLKILSEEECRPFDINRKGLNLGEGAAYLLLESEDSIKKRRGQALAEIVGYGNANDAYHQTASSPDGRGACRAMEKTLSEAGLSPDSIDYINAHGTGTFNNDEAESQAIRAIFKAGVPAYSSTKSYTGHTLAAAGAVEAVYSILALQNQEIYPNLGFQQAMDILPPPIDHWQPAKLDYVLSNSFGFGGNCTSLLFSRI